VNPLRITTNAQFDLWLAKHEYFEEGFVLGLEPRCPSDLLDFVKLKMSYQIEGRYEAGSKRVCRVFDFVAHGIKTFDIGDPEGVVVEHGSEGIELIDVTEGIGFTLDLPSRLTIIGSYLVVEELPPVEDLTPLWLSQREFTVNVPGQSVPAPLSWLTWMNEVGQDVLWHMNKGDPEDVREVPQGYTGWFLQRKDLYAGNEISDEQGLFVFDCKPDGSGFTITFQNHGATDELWAAAKLICGSFDGAIIRCGNGVFSGRNWRELYSGRLQSHANPD
jgi:hypothetical protein